MYELVATGGILDINEFSRHDEESFAEGQRGHVDFDCRWPVGQYVIDQLNQELINNRVDEGTAEQIGQTVRVHFRKGFAWLAVISAIILALIVLAILIVSWSIYREVVDIIPEPLKPVFGIAVAAIVAVVAWSLVKKRLPGKGG